MTVDIVAIGEPLYEFNQQSDGRFLPGIGGDVSNVAIAASRLGARVAMVTKLGVDPFGDAIDEVWRNEGVDASAVGRSPAAQTGIYFVSHGQTGHTFRYYRSHSAASQLAEADIPEALVTGAKFLHVSGISQAISATARTAVERAIAIAREAGVRLSYDTNFRERLWTAGEARPTVAATAARAAVLKTSLEDAEALFGLRTPEDAAAHFLALGSAAVIVTLGAAGVLVATPGARSRIEGRRVAAVDATGAGDAFTGALLTELCHGREIEAAARFAVAAAALSTLGYGAVAALPDRAAVDRFLACDH